MDGVRIQGVDDGIRKFAFCCCRIDRQDEKPSVSNMRSFKYAEQLRLLGKSNNGLVGTRDMATSTTNLGNPQHVPQNMTQQVEGNGASGGDLCVPVLSVATGRTPSADKQPLSNDGWDSTWCARMGIGGGARKVMAGFVGLVEVNLLGLALRQKEPECWKTSRLGPFDRRWPKFWCC